MRCLPRGCGGEKEPLPTPATASAQGRRHGRARPAPTPPIAARLSRPAPPFRAPAANGSRARRRGGERRQGATALAASPARPCPAAPGGLVRGGSAAGPGGADTAADCRGAVAGGSGRAGTKSSGWRCRAVPRGLPRAAVPDQAPSPLAAALKPFSGHWGPRGVPIAQGLRRAWQSFRSRQIHLRTAPSFPVGQSPVPPEPYAPRAPCPRSPVPPEPCAPRSPMPPVPCAPRAPCPPSPVPPSPVPPALRRPCPAGVVAGPRCAAAAVPPGPCPRPGRAHPRRPLERCRSWPPAAPPRAGQLRAAPRLAAPSAPGGRPGVAGRGLGAASGPEPKCQAAVSGPGGSAAAPRGCGMDEEEEDTSEFKERCAQCSEVNWGLTDGGGFYCRSCHNVIETTREAVSTEFVCNSRVQTLTKGSRHRKEKGGGSEWYICEGFQLVLKKQAEALAALGVSPQMKDEVLGRFWRCYLQKSKQAYCSRPAGAPARASSACESSTDVDSDPGTASILQLLSQSESEGDLQTDCSLASSATRLSGSTSACSGSVDGSLYLRERSREKLRMTMPTTLAFCYLALLWLREPLTLSDLLRFVAEGHIPYLNVFQHFPERMKLCGLDLKIFSVESWPGYEEVHSRMLELAAFLELPQFPEVTPSCFLHPDMLCIRYLLEANLPDELHGWTCLLVRKLGLGAAALTPGPGCRLRHDLLAAALIVVALKLLFLLDDRYEWLLSDLAEERNKSSPEAGPCFELKRWYRVVSSALHSKQQRLEEERAKCLWRCEKPLSYSAQKKCRVLKRRETAVRLQHQFGKLAGRVAAAEKPKPASFQFQWPEESPAGSCFHGHSLQAAVQEGCSPPRPLNPHYWLCTGKLCSQRLCGRLAHYRGVDFPQSYHFVLRFFSFVLRVEPSSLHQEVCLLEHKLFHRRLSKKPRASRRQRR
ncbi:TATA box-binding protein-associated factor RNA polymerase I subunit B [Dryobates pubescens]|uniref:TATA box-binding protein-associated factor RNA polymerase I subunit B n=1 Tax=Dryobates pubescens TaxID=118200 RepID=UPI0023B8ABD1|nr:TATA box-binding protein-associated factor RNA polymerase I subunit B [Dryobates pubescens]